MKRSAALLFALFAAGCAQSTEKYPSLALRPIESRPDTEEVTPTPEATPDAALDAQVVALSARLATLDTAFAGSATRAETAAKSPAARTTGSDQWLTAQTALAEIEGLRGDTLGLVDDIEQKVTDRGVAGAPPYPALDALHAKAQGQLDAETVRIDAVKAILGEK